jgi:hypothetical protein
VIAEKNNRRSTRARIDLAGGTVRSGTRIRKSRKFPGELVEPSHRACALIRGSALVTDASRKSRGDNGNNQKDDKRKKLMRLRYLKSVERLDKKEIVREE